jgi:hypothetical protein
MSNCRKLALLIAVLFVVDQVFGQGCSQCRLISEQGAGHGGAEVTEDSFGSNINFGILYLMAIPYILLMFFFRKQIARVFKTLIKR